MNFQTIPPIDGANSYLDLAFRKARERGIERDLKGNWLQKIRQKECLKIDTITGTIIAKLDKTLQTLPGLKDLAPFYIKLMILTLNYPLYKQSCASIPLAIKKIRYLQKDYINKINHTTENSRIKQISNEFYGRISSVLKQINNNLKYLEESRRIMKTYPDIKEMYTVCIYGFPNVGKTTLLNKLTGTTAKVAPYAFTTLTINSGHLKINNQTIQILDVPGTLARQEKMNLIELQADLVLKELANIIIYVFDISEYGGYSTKKQEQLLQNLKKDKKVLIYISKSDLVDQTTLENIKHRHYDLKSLKEEIGKEIEKDTPSQN